MAPAKLEGSARDRLLAAADELFYAEGINAVGIDRVIERAGVAKASLYNTFGSKDELVRAYLEARAAARKERVAAALAEHDEPRDKILAIYDQFAERCAQPDYKGCCFLNASAEDPSGDSVAREVSRAIRKWVQGQFLALARTLPGLTATAADTLGAQLALQYDGAIVATTLDKDRAAPLRARAIAAQLIDAASRSRRR